eukprot:TRINITY_DN6982_c0_g7_i3.p1 TRINITY_DN6982_c0_g7~~TRINITY_DN6982_c0_g7_i3.p1  ORF type:complete len:395 (-),score=71.32 TRINITY_DN6982_c0_g7_i3:83-1267(-)
MWRLEIEGKDHKIELLTSTVSGKKRVLKDGYLVVEKQVRFGEFGHSMPVDNHVVSIVEEEKEYELRVDNLPFSLLERSSTSKEDIKSDSRSQPTPNNDFQDPANFSAYPQTSSQYQTFHTSSTSSDRAELPMGYRLGAEEESPYIGSKAPKGQFSWDGARDFEFGSVQRPQVPGIFALQMARKKEKRVAPKAKAQLETPVAKSVPATRAEPIVSQPTAPPVQYIPQPIAREEPKPLIDLLDVKKLEENELPDLFADPDTSLMPVPTQPIPNAAKSEVQMEFGVSRENDYLSQAFSQANNPSGNYHPHDGLVEGNVEFASGFNAMPFNQTAEEAKPKATPYFTTTPSVNMGTEAAVNPYAMAYGTYMNPMMQRPYFPQQNVRYPFCPLTNVHGEL